MLKVFLILACSLLSDLIKKFLKLLNIYKTLMVFMKVTLSNITEWGILLPIYYLNTLGVIIWNICYDKTLDKTANAFINHQQNIDESSTFKSMYIIFVVANVLHKWIYLSY